MEEVLYKEYKQIRKQGLKVKGYWFNIQAEQLLKEMEPDASFKFSTGWFNAFKVCRKISFTRSKNTAQKPADDKQSRDSTETSVELQVSEVSWLDQ